MRSLVIVALLTGIASAQAPDPPDPTDQQLPDVSKYVTDFDKMNADQNRQFQADWDRQQAERDRQYQEETKRMDETFNHSALYTFGGFIVFVGLMITGAAFSYRRRRELALSYAETPIEYEPLVRNEFGGFDVSTLRIAVDGRASKFVQTELAAIVKQYDLASQDSRARCLRETSIMLRRVRDSWLYVGAENAPMRPQQETLAAYQKLVADARSRVTLSKGSAPATTSGDGVILVSIIVAARGELMTITDLATGEDLRRALESALDRAPSEILAVDIVWEPTEEGRALSSADLEAAYRTSELHRLSGSSAGKAFCTYCGGPFPVELVTCPHCGAPARESRRAS